MSNSNGNKIGWDSVKVGRMMEIVNDSEEVMSVFKIDCGDGVKR